MNLKEKIYDLLRWSEKYTKTDMIYLTKGGFWLTLSKMGGMIISFLLAIIWARFISKEVYGQYKFIISIAGLLAIFSLPGMATAITQAVARGFDRTIKPIVKTKLKWSVLGVIAGFSLAFYYWWRGNQILAISFFIVGFLFPLVNSFTVYGNYLAGKKRFDLQAKYGLTENFLLALATATAIFLTKNVIYLILVYFASRAALHVFFYLFVLKKIPPSKNIDPKAINYGKHLSLMGVLGTIATNIDKILLFHFLGATELAIYSFATLIPDQVRSMLKSITELAFPKFAIKSHKEIKKSITKKFWRLFILTILAIIIYILVAPFIYKIFFPQYLASVPYSQFYIFYLIEFPASLVGITFLAKMMKKELYWLRISLLLRIILFITLIPFFGVWGAVTAMVIERIFMGSFLILFLFKKF